MQCRHNNFSLFILRVNVIEKHVEDCIQVNNDDEDETKRIDAAELMQQKR